MPTSREHIASLRGPMRALFSPLLIVAAVATAVTVAAHSTADAAVTRTTRHSRPGTHRRQRSGDRQCPMTMNDDGPSLSISAQERTISQMKAVIRWMSGKRIFCGSELGRGVA